MKIRTVLAAVALLVMSLMAASPASAQYLGPAETPKAGPVAQPVVVGPAAPAPVKVQVGRATRPTQPRRFALTGADVAQMILIGGAFVVGGAVLVRQTRRRVTPAS